MLTVQDLYDLSHSAAGAYLSGFTYPWEALSGIKQLILSLGEHLGDDYEEVKPQVWVHKRHCSPYGLSGCPLHHRGRYRGPALRFRPGQRPGWRKLRGGQLRRAEKRDPLRQCPGPPL